MRAAVVVAIPLLLTASLAAAANDVLVTGATPRWSGAATASPHTGDVAAVANALQAIEHGRGADADQIAASVRDPAARKVIEWMRLRRDTNGLGFQRYAAFAHDNPGWPSNGMFRRRAEGALWEDKAPPATVLAYFGRNMPLSGKGKLALARAKLAHGDREGAAALVRSAWRDDALHKDVEDDVLREFGSLLTRADHKARTDYFLFTEATDDALRNAHRVSSAMVAVAKARIAAIRKDPKLRNLLEAVPHDARNEPSYIYARSQYHRRENQARTAADWLAKAPREAKSKVDGDQWWIERRIVTRHLLDAGDARAAYKIAAAAAQPVKENYRIDREFLAGWIALRFLHEPATARTHFTRILQLTSNPTSTSRGHYWIGRAAEATGDRNAARASYEKGARVVSAYYGQLCRAKLGRNDLPLAPLPHPAPQARAAFLASEPARAIRLLYELGRTDLTTIMVADLAHQIRDRDQLAALAELVTQAKDPRAMLLVGRAGLNAGLPFEAAAFPAIGLPRYPAAAPAADIPVVYAIARQESAFNPGTVSTANALGYMQVTPEAGRYVAKKFGLPFDVKRLLSDPTYNMQMGALELGDLIQDYENLIMAFAGYNAGRGRVRDWVEKYGDPRDLKVDPVDWVERIPFSETRNYVQRVLENLQIYRVQFSGRNAMRIEADLRAVR